MSVGRLSRENGDIRERDPRTRKRDGSPSESASEKSPSFSDLVLSFSLSLAGRRPLVSGPSTCRLINRTALVPRFRSRNKDP